MRKILFLAPLIVAGCAGNTILAKPTRLFVGREPGGVTAPDINGDGKADLLVARDFSHGQLGVLLGNGDGTFQPAKDIIGGDFPRFVWVADLDGDGKADLVAANLVHGGFVSVLLGHGDGTFEAPVNYVAGNSPTSVRAYDMNGDGKLDLVVVNSRPDSYETTADIHSNVTILLGHGDGTFQAGATFDYGQDIRGIAVGDWNGDGKLDLAIADDYGHRLDLLVNQGDATFRQMASYPMSFGAKSVKVVDLNGDKLPDLVIRHSGISVLLNAGDGTFRRGGDFFTGPTGSVDVADFNGDGIPDVAAARRLLLGDGKGGFPTSIEFDPYNEESIVWAADFNGDGRPDLAISDRVRNRVSIYLNKSQPAGSHLSLAKASR